MAVPIWSTGSTGIASGPTSRTSPTIAVCGGSVKCIKSSTSMPTYQALSTRAVLLTDLTFNKVIRCTLPGAVPRRDRASGTACPHPRRGPTVATLTSTPASNGLDQPGRHLDHAGRLELPDGLRAPTRAAQGSRSIAEVTYEGKPVTKGTVSFTAVDPDGRNAAPARSIPTGPLLACKPRRPATELSARGLRRDHLRPRCAHRRLRPQVTGPSQNF